MSFRTLYAALAVFCMVFPVCAEPAQTHSAPAADSLLADYYRLCKSRVNTPEGPAMCDTLFRRAQAAGNVRMQAIALCVRLDHFYFRNERDSIVAGVQRVQEFCRNHPQDDLDYFYYFTWSSRLITFYIKQNQPNTALYETRRMLEEAEKDDYPLGIASCYRMLANLYQMQGAPRLAYENFRRQIDVLERSGVDDINLPTQYAAMAQCALELNMPDSALMALRKADSLPRKTNYQKFTVNKAFGLYYIDRKDFATAGRYVEAAEKLFRDDPSLRPYVTGLRYLRTLYYKASGQYAKALESVIATRLDTVVVSSDYHNYSLSKELGDIYWHMGRTAEAAESYRAYIRLSDSVRRNEVRAATDDFAGILEIGRLQSEARELQYDIQRKRLHYTYVIIGLLACMLVLGGLVIARVMTLNRRLKASEATVLKQNEELRATGEELLQAKESAEQASRMKTDFIRHMSHEVRTPLNSIVGFSQVLASQFRDIPSMGDYASIIVSNSMNLLRLIDDVLDIAYLDQTPVLPRLDAGRLNESCRECMDDTLPLLKPGVTLMFEPSSGDPVVLANVKRIKQVLMHLLHNAAKFTVRGAVTFNYTCLVEEQLLRFTVSDTGPGIPSERREEVFERFVKLDTFEQGSGLGLPVCRMIAAKLGGRLEVDSGYTQGCRFVFEVPFDFPEEAA